MWRERIVFIAARFPYPVATFLTENGYHVLEVSSADKAFQLSTADDINAVIVAERRARDLAELRHRRISLNLSIHATGPDVFFEPHIYASSPQGCVLTKIESASISRWRSLQGCFR